MAEQFRQEKDSIGIKEIPADVYYGVQTARAVENYPISGMRANPTLIRAIGMVKYAAAQANKELGLVDDKRADAIMQAAKEVVDGKWDASFVVDVFQAGAAFMGVPFGCFAGPGVDVWNSQCATGGTTHPFEAGVAALPGGQVPECRVATGAHLVLLSQARRTAT